MFSSAEKKYKQYLNKHAHVLTTDASLFYITFVSRTVNDSNVFILHIFIIPIDVILILYNFRLLDYFYTHIVPRVNCCCESF